jgi:excisionase family DNA binding protein
VSLTPLQVAEDLGVCRKTVYSMLARGDIRWFPVGRQKRIEESELLRFKQEGPCRSSKSKGSGKYQVPKGESDFIAFCQKGRRKQTLQNSKESSGVRFLIPRS